MSYIHHIIRFGVWWMRFGIMEDGLGWWWVVGLSTLSVDIFIGEICVGWMKGIEHLLFGVGRVFVVE